jgi:hypothetical protein
MRYTIQLEMLERNAALADREAIALLHDELLLALNAGCFIALSSDEIACHVVGRSTPQEGVTRYTIELELEERSAGLGGHDAAALVQQAFTAALNASYFLRICTDDLVPVRLVSRTVAVETWLRAA